MVVFSALARFGQAEAQRKSRSEILPRSDTHRLKYFMFDNDRATSFHLLLQDYRQLGFVRPLTWDCLQSFRSSRAEVLPLAFQTPTFLSSNKFSELLEA